MNTLAAKKRVKKRDMLAFGSLITLITGYLIVQTFAADPVSNQSLNASQPAANIWVDSDGGSCERGDSAAYNDQSACGSAQAAFTIAQCGDVVRVRPGTYASFALTSGSKSCTKETMITIRPESDAQNSYGVPSGVITSGISINTANAWVDFQDFDTFTDPGATSGTIQSQLADASSSAHSRFTRIDAERAYFESSDVEVKGGSIGGFDSCTDGNHDGMSIWGNYDASKGIANWSNRVTIDGVLFHDIRRTCGSLHTDALAVGGGDGHKIINNRVYSGPTQGIFGRPYNSTLPITNLLVENNMIGSISDGTAGITFCTDPNDSCSGIKIRYNTVASARIEVESGGTEVVGNIGYSWIITGVSTVANNVRLGPTSPGGTASYSCTPVWKNANAVSTGLLHLASTDTCAIDKGHSSIVPATDFDGESRSAGSADIGADEYHETSSPAPTLQGDINGSGKVDILDLSALLFDYGKTRTQAANANCDINNDDFVNILDLSALLSAYGASS